MPNPPLRVTADPKLPAHPSARSRLHGILQDQSRPYRRRRDLHGHLPRRLRGDRPVGDRCLGRRRHRVRRLLSPEL